MNELQAILRMEGIKVTPPTAKLPAQVTVDLVSDGGRTDRLLEFVGTSCGEAMVVRITPLRTYGELGEEPEVEDRWQGTCLVGRASVAPPGKDESIPRVKFSLTVEGRHKGSTLEADPADHRLLELVKMRLAMMGRGASRVDVSLALEQRRLDLMPGAAPEED